MARDAMNGAAACCLLIAAACSSKGEPTAAPSLDATAAPTTETDGGLRCCIPGEAVSPANCGLIAPDGGCNNCCHGDACGYPPDPDGTCRGVAGLPAPLPAVRIAFSPEDGLSAVRSNPLGLWAEDDSGKPVDPTLLQGLGVELELRTYPELAPVAASVDAPSQPEPGRAMIALTPAAPLASRWYVLLVANVPTGVVPQDWLGLVGGKAGAYAARFHPDSAPVRTSIQLCRKPNAGRVVLSFSEPVDVTPWTTGAIPLAVSDATGAACPLAQGGAPAQPTLYFDCPAFPPPGAARLHLATTADFKTAGGKPVGVWNPQPTGVGDVVIGAPAAEEIDLNKVPEVSNCLALRF